MMTLKEGYLVKYFLLYKKKLDMYIHMKNESSITFITMSSWAPKSLKFMKDWATRFWEAKGV